MIEEGELVTAARASILALEVSTLLEELKTGRLTPTAVLQAYQAKALVVDKDLNAICDFILEVNL